MAPEPTAHANSEKTVGRAGFLGGLLAFVSFVALSVVGLGHSRSVEGAANAQFWVVVALVAATMAAVTVGLAREPARTRAGELARKIGVALAVVWLGLFVWETIAIGAFGDGGPIELAWAAWTG